MKTKISQAIVVEGRDDVDAVGKAVDALLIPTHGFGIRQETWALIERAYREKGIIILTDPDFSGEEIRRKLTERFPDAIQAYVAQEDALAAGDIGIENAKPAVITAAIEQALENTDRLKQSGALPEDYEAVDMAVLARLGLAAADGAAELREAVCDRLGIGYGNAKAMVAKLSHWGIGIKELEQAIEEIR